ncbi:SEC-C metal-binding domain-containing protein [Desulfosporosinus shakirovi]|uniref:SEC-C metal-binding domain-containing protein n=1 Tax=Desulfosporosinus shakirovi TaxID=2885154 RepID=UPI0037C15DEC|nr:SEC-C domain-containing protein [Desulfosporosinus sp. SRJS8]
MKLVGRNAPCICGNEKKYNKCCGANISVDITDDSTGKGFLSQDNKSLRTPCSHSWNRSNFRNPWLD